MFNRLKGSVRAMLNINIITVGKLKESYLKQACEEYIKRLTVFCKLSVIELPESRLPEKPSEKEITAALFSEGQAVFVLAPFKTGYNIALCIEGEQINSMGLSQHMENIAVNGKSIINFIIGSSFGISSELKKSVNYRLSMSKMTFPHQLARVMLFEQIYRAVQISNNGKYHK